MSYGLYYLNSLLRCFEGTIIRFESADILLKHILSRKITIFEKDVLLGCLNKLLTYNERELYPFNALSKFFEKN